MTRWIDNTIKVLAAVVIGWVLIITLASQLPAATAESNVHVYAAYLDAIAVPDLPDTLNNRPRINETLPQTAPLPNIFEPYDDPWRGAAAPGEPGDDEPLANLPEVDRMQWALKNLLPYETLIVFEQDHRNCPPCKAYHEGTCAVLFKAGWNIRVVNVASKQDAFLTEYFDPAVTPTTVALRGGEEIGRITGNAHWRQVTALFKPKQSLVRSQPTPRIVGGPSTNCLHLRGGQWTWPGGTIGSLRRHLVGPPHNFPRDVVDGMTPNRLVAAHDSWHNSHSGGGASAMRSQRPRLRNRGGGWPMTL